MEAMRACTKTSCVIPVVVIKLGALDAEILRPRRNNSMWGSPIDFVLRIFSSTDDKAANDLSVAVNDVLSQREFNTSQYVIGGLKVDKLDSSDTLSDRTIATILIRDQVAELCNNRWIVRVGVVRVRSIVNHWLARVSSWDQIVEDSQAVSSI